MIEGEKEARSTMDKLKQAELLYIEGKKDQAAKLLMAILRQEPSNFKAWYGLALTLDEPEKKIYCLKKVLTLAPSHKKARRLLEQLQRSPEDTFLEREVTESRERRGGNGDFLFNVLVGIVLLLVLLVIGGGVWQTHVNAQRQNAQATATAEYVACKEKFEDQFVQLLSRFFRQENIADVTARINLPEQISRLEEIRTEAWNMPEKTCEPKVHALMMDYMDKSIATYVQFASDTDDAQTGSLYVESLVALAHLDDEVVQEFDRGGLLGLFRSKGYFYWEGLNDPDWKKGLGSSG